MVFRGDILLPHADIRLQRMAADIDAKNLLLHLQALIPAELPDIRHRNLPCAGILLSVLRFQKIEQGQLTTHLVLPFSRRRIKDLRVGHHHLLPGRPEAVEGPGLDEVLGGTLIHLIPDPLRK